MNRNPLISWLIYGEKQRYYSTIEQMNNTISQYTLIVKAKNEQSFVITGSDIDLYYDFEQLVNDEFEKQHKKFYIGAFFEKNNINAVLDAHYSDEKLSSILDGIDIVNNGIDPVNAKIVFNSEKQCAEIEPEAMSLT